MTGLVPAAGRAKTLASAFRYSIPVLLGYLALGAAYGLAVTGAGLPWWLAPLSSAVIYAGSGQFLAVALFARGSGLAEIVLAEFLLNARHIAYGFSRLRRIEADRRFKWYLVFSLTDETFALVSALPETPEDGVDPARLARYIAALDHAYWFAGSALGAAAGAIVPFNFEGASFALTALFVVLMVEQMRAIKRAGPFAVSALTALIAAAALPARAALPVSLVVSVALVHLMGRAREKAA
jgi:4-azaleucine resistance transporter AzlC